MSQLELCILAQEQVTYVVELTWTNEPTECNCARNADRETKAKRNQILGNVISAAGNSGRNRW